MRNRPRGSIDAYTVAVGRWLVTRDGFDFPAHYLSDYDYASHAQGPDAAHAALARCDVAVGTLIEAAGGLDELSAMWSSSAPTTARPPWNEVARLQNVFPENSRDRFEPRGHGVHRPRSSGARSCSSTANEAVDVVLWREGDEAVARRDGAELRFTSTGSTGDPAILDHPEGRERAWAALANPNAGELIVSAATGWEFADLGGRHHAGRFGTGRSSSETRRSRCSRSESTRCPDRSWEVMSGGARSTSDLGPPAPDTLARFVQRESPAGTRRPYLRRRGIDDARVLEAIGRVPRELFVPEELRRRAYDDRALPIGHGQTISQPFMVAAICAALDLDGDERVLDVGTGSGYQAAVLAELAAEVVTIERVGALAERAHSGACSCRLRAGRGAGRRRHARCSRAGSLRRDRRRGRRPLGAGGAVRPARSGGAWSWCRSEAGAISSSRS